MNGTFVKSRCYILPKCCSLRIVDIIMIQQKYILSVLSLPPTHVLSLQTCSTSVFQLVNVAPTVFYENRKRTAWCTSSVIRVYTTYWLTCTSIFQIINVAPPVLYENRTRTAWYTSSILRV